MKNDKPTHSRDELSEERESVVRLRISRRVTLRGSSLYQIAAAPSAKQMVT